MSDAADPKPLTMKDLFALALERGASDLHLKAGQPPLLRVDGMIQATALPALGADQILALAREIMDPRVAGQFEEIGAADFSQPTESGDRFRLNIYRQRGLTSVSARRVSRHIRTFRDLHLPEATMERICETRQGLVIFSGTTGCGKSTSIASCLEYINTHRRCHIVSLEDPIEFLFEDKLAFIDQREIGTDVPDYVVALRNLMREDPNVVLVGELRDKEAVEGVLRAAETTRLVFTTVHAASVTGIIVRILAFFSPEERPLVREALAATLVGAICQKLVLCADPNVGLLPATEVMVTTPTIRKMIRDGEEGNLGPMIAAGNDLGMHDFTQDLARLVREEWVDPKVAYEVAPNPDALKLAIRGIAFRKGTIR